MTRGWTALSGARIGSVHVRDEMPLQDAHAVRVDGAAALIAVADGHGHHAHFRSDVGSALAVELVVDLLHDALPRLTDPTTAHGVLAGVGADLVDRWTAGVVEHLRHHPLDPPADADRALLTGPYGSTVLAMVATGDLVGVLQIGDGDAVVVTAAGRALRPLPEDPALDGARTTSLCQPAPLESLRIGVLDATAQDVVLGYLATDGFSAARVDPEAWWQDTGAELTSYAREHGFDWIAERLPAWLEEPARIGGDDTTLAILARADLDPHAPG